MSIIDGPTLDYRGLEFVGDHHDPELEKLILETSAHRQSMPILGEIFHDQRLNDRLAAMNMVMGQIATEVDVDVASRIPPVTAYRLFGSQSKMNSALAQLNLPKTEGQGYCDGINIFAVDPDGCEKSLLGIAAHELGHFVAKRRLELLAPPEEGFVVQTCGLLVASESSERRRMIDEPLMDILKIDQVNRWRNVDQLSDSGALPDKVELSYPGVYVLGGLIKAVAQTNRSDEYGTYRAFLKGHLEGDDTILTDTKESLPPALHNAYDDFLRANPNSFESSIAAANALQLPHAKQALESYFDMFIKTPRIFEWLDRPQS